MGSQLLQKEREYHELNKQLELKTKELLHEVDNVIKLKNNILALNEQPKHETKRSYSCESHLQPVKKSTKPRENAIKLDAKDLTELNLPEDVNNMGAKGMVHFLKAKMKKMQTDYEKITKDCKSKCEEMKNMQKENQTLLDDKEKWMQTSLAGKSQITKLENQITNLSAKLQTKNVEITGLQKEVEQLQKELKCCKMNVSNVEIKSNRLIEDHEKVKAALKAAKQEEKDLRDNHRREIAELTGTLKRIEKHKNELLNGFKKQMLLIENLKKQKIHIGALKLNEKVDEEFKHFLDWKQD